jgi:kynurenine 3-monooxygenase
MMRTDRFDFEQKYLGHGYREVEMRPAVGGGFRMREDCLHIWPRGEFMLMALPNPDRTFTCTLFAPYEGENGLNAIESAAAARAYFNKHFPDVMPLLPDFDEDWARHPTSSLVMTRCFPWNFGGRVALMGDAAHAIVPFYGQGMNSGMEDCTVLDELMDAHGDDWEAMFAQYTELRKPAGDAILELALRNYIEMRDKTGDKRFLLQKRIEARLAQRYPGRWLPLYSQVTFSHTPYHEALAAGKRQDEIMAKVMARPDIAEVWNHDEVAEAAMAMLEANPQVQA